MAKDLNKKRIRYTYFGLVALFVASIFSESTYREGAFIHGAFDMIGVVLVGICALGRLWCTAFLGGHKNATLITYGPFSIVRNPLYVFSFIGVCGVVLISNHISFILLVPPVFLMMYSALIRREEVFLNAQFGDDYRGYCARVPRLVPRISTYQAPETVPMCPKFMLFALRDSLLWLAILPLFELIEELQESGIITPLLYLP